MENSIFFFYFFETFPNNTWLSSAGAEEFWPCWGAAHTYISLFTTPYPAVKVEAPSVEGNEEWKKSFSVDNSIYFLQKVSELYKKTRYAIIFMTEVIEHPVFAGKWWIKLKMTPALSVSPL